jgi:threonyl-tRNA synthetase
MSENNKLTPLRHSCEHVLMQAMQRLYPNKFLMAMGPATSEGFYFDFEPTNNFKISEENFPEIEAEMIKIMKESLPIKKESISLQKAQEIFADNPYKLDWLKNIQNPTIYKTGDEFTDLCAGPHVESTNKIGIFKLLSIAGAYWHGDEKNKMLTRIYGTAFNTPKELKKYLNNLEESKKRDHRKLGPQLDLFFIHETAPGMPYWLPKGTIIYNELLNFWRVEHQKRGYQETITPLLNKKELYETSGHWEHYQENMFKSEINDQEIYCLKPMNCPNAMVVFDHQTRSYKDLPLRFSDCDTLHRHEKSGELNGLLRVQKFNQDDAHIFITEDQISEEYGKILEICKLFYSTFGIDFRIRLGTRPTDFMGDSKIWDKAEKDLQQIMDNAKIDYFIGEGDGAFYGPKLDIMMTDCMNRQWQTGTIQLDFQLPKRFKLKYTDKDGQEKTPVVIHRVIFGSLERFIAILIEQFAGAFPVWLSPIQVQIIPITDNQIEYAQKLGKILEENNIRYEINDKAETMQNKIRNASTQKIPYMLICGGREASSQDLQVSVRQRNGIDLKNMSLAEFIKEIKNQINKKSLNLIK